MSEAGVGHGGEAPGEGHRFPGHRVRDRFGLLLLLLVASFLMLGLASHTWARVVAGLLGVSALAVAFLATGLLRGLWVAMLVALGVAGAGLTSSSASGIPFGIGSLLYTLVFVAMLTSVLIRVLRHRRVTVQTLYGAVCAYMIIGLLFAGVYGALDGLGATPLFGQSVAEPVYSYFSFTTMTTAGFGDYTAKTALARRLVAIEAVAGQIFIATTLARMVSLFRRP